MASYGSYQGNYSSYQTTNNNNNRSRRRDYDDISSNNGHAYAAGAPNIRNFSDDRRHQEHYPSSSSQQKRMQTMEVLSGREYEKEFDYSSDSSGLKNRWTMYASLALLILIVILAPHRNHAEDSNFKLPKNAAKQNNNAVNASIATTSNSVAAINSSITKTTKDETNEEENTQPPSATTNAKQNSTNTSQASIPASYAETCLLPPVFRQDADTQLTFLDSNRLCLDELLTDACTCSNPTQPAKPSYTPEQWLATHELNVGLVNASLEAKRDLDIVFLGDSITEHWNGRSMGTFKKKLVNDSIAFQTLFQKSQNNSQIEGLALGIAGDRCPNVLWRMQHGELPPSLNPKVFWILIGTNDLGSDSCNANAIIAGNIRIVEQVRRHNATVPIVINSIMPRSREELLHHNPYWKITQQINARLECYASTQEDVIFFNATSLFVTEDKSNEKDYGVEMYINETLMNDYLHPSGVGSMLWGQVIVDAVLNLTKTTGNDKGGKL